MDNILYQAIMNEPIGEFIIPDKTQKVFLPLSVISICYKISKVAWIIDFGMFAWLKCFRKLRRGLPVDIQTMTELRATTRNMSREKTIKLFPYDSVMYVTSNKQKYVLSICNKIIILVEMIKCLCDTFRVFCRIRICDFCR